MHKLLTTSALLTLIATPAFAQSFDPDNGTGNVLSFRAQQTAPQNNVRQSGIRAYGMVAQTRSAHVPRRHEEGAGYHGNWGFAPGNRADPEVNDPVGVVHYPQR